MQPPRTHSGRVLTLPLLASSLPLSGAGRGPFTYVAALTQSLRRGYPARTTPPDPSRPAQQPPVQAVDLPDERVQREAGPNVGAPPLALLAPPRAHRRDSPRSLRAIAASSPTAVIRPVSPSTTALATPPTAVVTTGTPAAWASINATGVPSLSEVCATTSDAK